MFAIGEIARKAGVAPSTIRYYERIGLLPPSQRVSGKRRYDVEILEKIAVIRLAQQAGYSIAEIHTLLHDFPEGTPPAERWQATGSRKVAELDDLLNRVQRMKFVLEKTLQCQCMSLDECGRERMGVEPTTHRSARCATSFED